MLCRSCGRLTFSSRFMLIPVFVNKFIRILKYYMYFDQNCESGNNNLKILNYFNEILVQSKCYMLASSFSSFTQKESALKIRYDGCWIFYLAFKNWNWLKFLLLFRLIIYSHIAKDWRPPPRKMYVLWMNTRSFDKFSQSMLQRLLRLNKKRKFVGPYHFFFVFFQIIVFL